MIRREVIAFWSANAGFGQLALNIIARSNISDGLGLYIGVSSIERTVLFAIVDCEGNPFQSLNIESETLVRSCSLSNSGAFSGDCSDLYTAYPSQTRFTNPDSNWCDYTGADISWSFA